VGGGGKTIRHFTLKKSVICLQGHKNSAKTRKMLTAEDSCVWFSIPDATGTLNVVDSSKFAQE